LEVNEKDWLQQGGRLQPGHCEMLDKPIETDNGIVRGTKPQGQRYHRRKKGSLLIAWLLIL
jgi:hypothetical protein